MLAFDEEFDVVVVGFGFAGAISAIEAADGGAKVLLIEKASVPGGISICAGGGVLCAADRDKAFAYLQALGKGRTPIEVLRSLADGMTDLEDYVRDLAKINGAEVVGQQGRLGLGGLGGIDGISLNPDGTVPDEFLGGGSYMLPGFETFYYTSIKSVPKFFPEKEFPAQSSSSTQKSGTFGGGVRVFKVVYDNVLKRRNVQVRYNSAAVRLIPGTKQREVRGITIKGENGKHTKVKARAVILACGGFEGNPAMQEQYWEGMPIGTAMAKSNTGDGILMAQELGAALWHMWHFHGSYGFRHPSPDYPYVIRTKRVPNWKPGREQTAQVKMPWILVDQFGKRYMNEYHPYVQDTNHRPMQHFDPVTQSYPRIPSLLICDDNGRRLYPLGQPTYNDPDILHYVWSQDNLKEVDLGILKKADSIRELAAQFKMKDPDAVEATVDRWNAAYHRGSDAEFGRPGGTMLPIDTPPYYGAEIWPLVSNTQGGLVHNAYQQAVNVYGEVLSRLYVVGELSSVFGHLYSAGGNIAECFVSGRNAVKHISGRGGK